MAFDQLTFDLMMQCQYLLPVFHLN